MKHRKSALCTHNHPEGVKGAQVIAGCGYLAKKRRFQKGNQKLCPEKIRILLEQAAQLLQGIFKV